MKNRFLPVLAGLLLATRVSAQPCLEVECPNKKMAQFGSRWHFDPPTVLVKHFESDVPKQMILGSSKS